jgi:spore coat polysaccharide biosynthesis protein SpsF
VQARLGSSRLPGKVLKPLAGGTVLAEVLRRCRAIRGVDVVVCAVPEGETDRPVVDEARRCGALVTLGCEMDVLDRHLKAARAVSADVVVRVTSDCPLIDPAVCSAILELRAKKNADYACNNLPPSFPHGLDCEVFTRDALETAWLEGLTPEDREHVTPWMRRSPKIRRAALVDPRGNFGHHRWTLDFPEDYKLLQAIFSLLAPAPDIRAWKEVATLLEGQPEILAINSHRNQR